MKKALALSTLALLLITATVGIGLGNLVYQFSKGIQEKNLVERCHTSMFFINQAKKQLGRAESVREELPVPDCPLVKKTFAGDPKTAIAEELKNCWYKTLGKDNLLGNTYFAFFHRSINYCLVCSEFVIEKEIKAEELTTHLANKKILKGEGVGKTYAHYLQSDYLQFYGGKILSELQQGKTYYVINLNHGEGTFEESFSSVSIVPADTIQNLNCDKYHYQYEAT